MHETCRAVAESVLDSAAAALKEKEKLDAEKAGAEYAYMVSDHNYQRALTIFASDFVNAVETIVRLAQESYRLR